MSSMRVMRNMMVIDINTPKKIDLVMRIRSGMDANRHKPRYRPKTWKITACTTTSTYCDDFCSAYIFNIKCLSYSCSAASTTAASRSWRLERVDFRKLSTSASPPRIFRVAVC